MGDIGFEVSHKMQVNEAIGAWAIVEEGNCPAVHGTMGAVRTHVWGVDLSGTTHGAGGVGGLVATVIHNGLNAGVYFAVYDGNGNVMGYVRASDGGVVAQYEYGPFGELLPTTGPLAQAFNHLFSTKYFDWETGLSYYGHRYYSPPPAGGQTETPLGSSGDEPLRHGGQRPGELVRRFRLVQEGGLPGEVFGFEEPPISVFLNPKLHGIGFGNSASRDS
ncbi:hypothetical protein NXS98_07575 [Fontisphaera persica]|uniref:hypothetical protein n=1 Tax=Fontisphaera persica TaxID=2974023 RepID=UPI0024BF1FB5|nr:hypothetical protein [Fontisphaera persica]WCJ60969.1 hypothetical protein NXS98_07575 [Fontisphaera persica]